MFRFCFPVICLLSCLPAHAEDSTALCPTTDDAANCVRVLACIGDKGRWFHGRSFGRGEGTLAGVMSDGVLCEGTWTSRNAMGFGQADVTCDDGMTTRVIFFYQDAYTGTAIGKGETSAGEGVQSWSGDHVLGYFKGGNPTADAIMRCGEHDIPIS